jgi:hypothetical protein
MKISHKDKVEWRKNQIQQLLAKGHYSHREIAGILLEMQQLQLLLHILFQVF